MDKEENKLNIYEHTPKSPKSMSEKIFLNIVRYGVYLSLLAPVIYLQAFYFPFVVPRAIFFRLIVDIISIAYIFLIISNGKYRPRGNILIIGVAIFVGVLFLTSFTGINFEKSFWGNFERMGGLLTFLHLFAFFIIVSSLFKERDDWEKFFTVSISAGIILLYIGISNQFPIHKGSTIGNSSFLAAYLLFDIFFAIILLFTKEGRWKLFYGGSLLILLLGLFATGCKGSIASFFVGMFLLTLSYFIFFQRKNLKWYILGTCLLLMFIFSSFLISPSNFIKNKIDSTIELPTAQARIVVWQISWEAWREKFLLGWGPENFSIAFNKHFDPRLSLNKYGGEVFFDKAHNIILDIGVSSGLLGVLSYLFIFVSAIFILLKKIFHSSDKKTLVLETGVLIILIIYTLQNLLVLDTVISYLMFFILLAFTANVSQKEKIEKFSSNFSPFLGGIIIILIIFAIVIGSVKPIMANLYINKIVTAPLETAISLFQKSLQDSPMGRLEASKALSEKIYQLVTNSVTNRETTESLENIENGVAILEEKIKKDISKNYLDFYFPLTLGRIYNNLFEITKNNDKLKSAEMYFNKATQLSPKSPEGYWGLAQTKLFEKDTNESFALFQKAIDLEPKLGESQLYLAIAYESAGRKDLAGKKILDIKNQGFDWQGKQKELIEIIYFFDRNNDSFSSMLLFSEITKTNPDLALKHFQKFITAPTNFNPWIPISIIYAQQGNIEKAKETIRKINFSPQVINELERFLETYIYKK